MSFGEIWPEPVPKHSALDRAADHNWSLIRDVGGAMVDGFRTRADEAYRAAEIARARGDLLCARRHWQDFEAAFRDLETYLAAVAP